jgi:hypothetical protein
LEAVVTEPVETVVPPVPQAGRVVSRGVVPSMPGRTANTEQIWPTAEAVAVNVAPMSPEAIFFSKTYAEEKEPSSLCAPVGRVHPVGVVKVCPL